MRRVVKIGGSLLKSPGLTSRLSQVQDLDSSANTLVIIGGGDLVNAVREIDQVANLDATETHWLCVDLLTQTFNIMKHQIDWPVIETVEDLLQWIEHPPSPATTTLVRVDTFYHRPSARETAKIQKPINADDWVRLPHNWETTTDSIAALLAKIVGAEELILLKSCSVPSQDTPTVLAEKGIVDQAFPDASEGISRVTVRKLA